MTISSKLLGITARRRTGRELALTLALALAAGTITFGLFAAMQFLIKTDDFSPPAQKTYEVSALMAVKSDPVIRTRGPKPPKPEPIQPPPQQAKLVKTISAPDAPGGVYLGAAPSEHGWPDFDNIRPQRVTAMRLRRLEPLTRPIPIYPSEAARRDLEGSCEVHFSVSTRGDPFDVRAICSDRAFKAAAEKSIRKVKFAPKVRDGVPVPVMGVIYPLEFRLEP
jgi:periplasmic protein TonB